MFGWEKCIFYVAGLVIVGISVGVLTHLSPTGFLVIGLSLMVAPLVDKLSR